VILRVGRPFLGGFFFEGARTVPFVKTLFNIPVDNTVQKEKI
jgi:hypothetical protein